MSFRRSTLVASSSLLFALVGCTASLKLEELQAGPLDTSGGRGGTGLPSGGGTSVAGSPAAGRGGSAGRAGGGSAGSSGAAGGAGSAGSLGGASSGGTSSGSAGSAGVGGSAGSAGVGGLAGNGGQTGGTGGLGGAGQAGVAGAGGIAGTGGTSSMPTCPTQATVLDTLTSAGATYRDLHTNGAQLAFFSTQSGKTFRLRPANLDKTEPVDVGAAIDLPVGGSIHAVRFGADTNMLLFAGSLVFFTQQQNGIPYCLPDAPAWALIMGNCEGTDRRIVTEGTLVAQVGCGEQAVGSTSAGGQICGNAEYLRAKDGSGTLGSATESIALALSGTKLYAVDRVGASYIVREKSFSPEKQKDAYTDTKNIGTIDVGRPRGLFVENGYAYTSVQGVSGRWDIRRYRLGVEDDMDILYEEIADLSAFGVNKGKVVWAREGGAANAGASIWRGGLSGAAFTPATLVACAPVAPLDLQITSSYVFFVDPLAVSGAPSLRGAAHGQP